MSESPFPKISNRKQRAFLTAFRETGNVRAACEAAGVARSSHYRWIDDPAYQEAFEVATDDAVDLLEAEVSRRRALQGWEEPTGWYKGQPGGLVRRYSDTLAIFLLKGMKPERYADRVELRGALANLDLTKLPDHMIEQIAQGVHPLVVLASAQDGDRGRFLPPADSDH